MVTITLFVFVVSDQFSDVNKKLKSSAVEMMKNHSVTLLLLIAALFISFSKAELVSPCPDLFKYETNSSEPDRWYGTLTLLTDSQLSGVWLRIAFDKRPLQIGNWFGELERREDNEYLIKNRNVKLSPNAPRTVRFYVKYNPQEPPPQLTGFRINARTVCPEEVSPPDAVATDIKEGTQEFTINEENSEQKYQASCGSTVEPPKNYTAEDQATYQGQFPWQAALYVSKGKNLIYQGSGTLVTRKHVITSGNVIKESSNPERWTVYLGKYYLDQWSNSDVTQARQVSIISVSPSGDPQDINSRPVILELSSPVEVTDFVRPVCLVDNYGANSKTGTVVGWGYDQQGRQINELTMAKVEITSDDPCIAVYEKGTTTICAGDIGAGIIVPKQINNNKHTEWQLRGIIYDTVKKETCDTQGKIFFIDINKYVDWIKEVSK